MWLPLHSYSSTGSTTGTSTLIYIIIIISIIISIIIISIISIIIIIISVNIIIIIIIIIRRSVMEFDIREVVMGCVFLGCKMEDITRKSRDIVMVFNYIFK